MDIKSPGSVPSGGRRAPAPARAGAGIPISGGRPATKNNGKKSVSAGKGGKDRRGLRVFFSVIISALLICFVTGCVVFGYVVMNILIFTNGDPVINLEETKANQNMTSIMYAEDKDGKTVEIARLHGEENRIWVDFDKIPENMIKAFVSLEDKRFWDHKGVDWFRLAAVMTKYSFDQGASTITQQLIKNLTNEKDVTFVRKFNEIRNALNLEKNYSKEKVLEAYLNTLYLGSGCYGVETAAETYFGKSVGELNLSECTVIAGITKAPYTYNPLYNPESNRSRQIECLDDMLEQGAISKAEYDQAVAYKLIFTNDPSYVSDEEDEDEKEETQIQSYYVDFVIDRVIDDLAKQYDYSKQEAWEKVYYGGLKIYTAVDLDIQAQLEDVYVNRVTFPKESNTEDSPAAQSAMTIMDYEGRVVAIVGGADEKTENRGLNRAADSPRQPGSTIKPLATYSPAIELNKVTWSSQVLNYAFPLPGEGYMWPHNVDGTLGSNTYVTVQYAIAQSLNTVPGRIINNMLGISTSLDWLMTKFHLSHVDTERDNGLSPMATGSMTYGMTTLEMASAYATFGNGGKYYEPYCYYKVTNSAGTEILLEPGHEGEQVMSPETSDVMCELLQTVPTSYYVVDGNDRNIRRSELFAKTGTTEDNHDRWFAGGTPYYVGAVWYGYDIPETLHVSTNPSGKIFFEVFDRVHEDLDGKEFKKSGKTVAKNYCTRTGLIAGKNCASTATGWYKTDYLPAVCTNCKATTIGQIAGNFWDYIFGRDEATTAPTAQGAPPETTAARPVGEAGDEGER